MKVNVYLFGAVLTLGLLPACSQPRQAPVRPSPQAVRVIPVRSGPIAEGRTYVAEVASQSMVRVLAQVGGTVAALPVEEGEAAEANDVLVRIAAPEMVARRARARSERRRVQQERDFACARLETDRVLAAAGDLPPEALEASKKACRTARLAVRAARAAERETRAITARSVERAPFEGRVLDRMVEVGQAVMPGTPLLMYGTRDLELVLQVPEGDIARGLREGLPVVFEGGRGEVREVGAWARGPGRMVEVRVRVTEGNDTLPQVGGTLPVRVVFDMREEALSVPVEALVTDGDAHYVLVLDGNRVRRQAVLPGPREEGWVAVEPTGSDSGRLVAGKRVVVSEPERVDVARPVLAVEVTS